MADPLDLDAAAHELLAAAADSLDAIPLADADLDGAPDRQFVSPGQPIADCCEWLSVHADLIPRLATGPVGAPAVSGKSGMTQQIRTGSLVITITRCLPAGRQVGRQYHPPTVAQNEAVAAQYNADGWALVNGILARIAAGVLFEGCTNVEVGAAAGVAPRGGCVGWVLPVTVQINRYTEPDLGS